MIRVSECKYFIASVYRSFVLIEETGAYFGEPENKSLGTEFQLEEGKYTFLEWPPLNHFYIASMRGLFVR